MQSDLPHTLLRHNRIGEGGGFKRGKNKETPAPKPDFQFDPNDPAIALQRAANNNKTERMEKKKRGEIPYTLNELFNH